MAMTAKPNSNVRKQKPVKRMYPRFDKDVFEKIEEVAGYEKYTFRLRTVNNISVYIPDITCLADVERCKVSIISALGTHKKLKAFPVPKKN